MKKIARIAVAAAICIFNTMEAKDGMETLTPKEKSIALSAAYAAKVILLKRFEEGLTGLNWA